LLYPFTPSTSVSTSISDQVLSKGHLFVHALLAPVQTCARRTIKVLDLNSKAAGDGKVVGAAAADDAGVVSNPTAIAETWGQQGAGDDAGGTDEAVGVVAAAAGDVGISGVERAVVIAAVIVVMAGGGIVGVAAGAVSVDAEGAGGVAKSGSIVSIAGGGGVGVAGAGSTDRADVVAGPEFAVAVGDVGVGGVGVEGAGVDRAGSVGGGGVDVAGAGAVIAETWHLWGASNVGGGGSGTVKVEGVH